MTKCKLNILYKHNNLDHGNVFHIHEETSMRTHRTRNMLYSLSKSYAHEGKREKKKKRKYRKKENLTVLSGRIRVSLKKKKKKKEGKTQ